MKQKHRGSAVGRLFFERGSMKLTLLTALGVALLLVAGAGVGASGQEKGKTDADKIQGSWTFVTVEKGGVESNDDIPKEAEVVFTADKVKIQAQGKEMEIGYKLDSAKKPKHIDFLVNEGGKEAVLKGIYALDGDTLKICFAPPGDKRPTELRSELGSSEMSVVMKRAK
jgi:uncharacterized protein (TIGR03067 family)